MVLRCEGFVMRAGWGDWWGEVWGEGGCWCRRHEKRCEAEDQTILLRIWVGRIEAKNGVRILCGKLEYLGELGASGGDRGVFIHFRLGAMLTCSGG
jgi:hypothetical protein